MITKSFEIITPDPKKRNYTSSPLYLDELLSVLGWTIGFKINNQSRLGAFEPEHVVRALDVTASMVPIEHVTTRFRIYLFSLETNNAKVIRTTKFLHASMVLLTIFDF